MKKVKGFKCISCGSEHALTAVKYICPACNGNLQVVYDYKFVKKRLNRKNLSLNKDWSLWRYLDILPVAGLKHAPEVQVGWTPLYKADKLGQELGLSNLYLKDDGRNPSASFKDRASAIVVARAMESGEPRVSTASTGNAASSLACLMASMEAKPVIFVPKTAPAPKLSQLLVFGAEVIAVHGGYDDAFELCIQACRRYGWYNRNTGYNPFTREGKKTCAFELCEQLEWKVPDKVFIPVGDGNIISGIWKGFCDFHALGLIGKLPQLIAVQAIGSDAVKRAVDGDGVIRPVQASTLADSISVNIPRDGLAAVRAVKESKGFAVSVADDEILAAVRSAARGANVFAEPAAAAAYAGLKKAVGSGLVKPRESVVVLITGNGLKDVEGAMKAAAGTPHVIEPDMDALQRLVQERKLV